MLCRIEMPYNEQIFGRFYRYKLMKNIGGGRAGLFFLPVIVIIFSVVMIMTNSSTLLPTAMIAALVLYFVFVLYLKPNSLFRAQPAAALRKEVTILTQNGLNRSIMSEEGGPSETESSNFAALYKAVETRRDFYLFTGPAQAYLLDKKYFTKGSPEELRTILREAMGDKFKSNFKA